MRTLKRIGIVVLVLTVSSPASSMAEGPSAACDAFMRTRERAPRLMTLWIEWSKVESIRMSRRPIPAEGPEVPWLNTYFDVVNSIDHVMGELETLCRLRPAIRPDADSVRLYEYYVCEGSGRARSLKEQLPLSYAFIKEKATLMPSIVDAARIAIDEQVAVWPVCELPTTRPVLKKK